MKTTPATIRNLACIAAGSTTKRAMMDAMDLKVSAVEHGIAIAMRENLIRHDVLDGTPHYALTDRGRTVLAGGADAKNEIIRRCLCCELWMKAETRTQRLCNPCGGYGTRLDAKGQRRQDRLEAEKMECAA